MASSPSSLPHIAIFPFMAKGHTVPLLHLAQLVCRRRLATVTFFTTPLNAPFIRQSLTGTNVTIISLPFQQNVPDFLNGVESTDNITSMQHHFLPFLHAAMQLQPHFERALQSVPTVDFLISDGFLGWTFESASKFGIPRVVFHGMCNYATNIISVLHRERPFDTGAQTFLVPGYPNLVISKDEIPVQNQELRDLMRENIRIAWNSHGLIVNSFLELEAVHHEYWNNTFTPKSWCVGPLCLADERPAIYKQSTWMDWLDSRSVMGRPVLYIAFGTQAKVSEQQLKEIAEGLELSGIDFLWVVRDEGPVFFKKFEERVKKRGMVVREWVDQQAILRHDSVKGFVSHCGWNSVMESICAGVPILAWPMMADQLLNARLVVDELHIGLRIARSKDGLVNGQEIGMMARMLIMGNEGKKATEKLKGFTDDAMRAMDVGGSSWHALKMLIDEASGKHQISADCGEEKI